MSQEVEEAGVEAPEKSKEGGGDGTEDHRLGTSVYLSSTSTHRWGHLLPDSLIDTSTQARRPHLFPEGPQEGPSWPGSAHRLTFVSPGPEEVPCHMWLPCLGRGMMAAQRSKASALAPGVLQSTPSAVVGEPSSETPGQRFWGFCYEE